MTALAPGATIGILGGGQLGRMLALAAAELGFDTHIYAPEADSIAARVAAKFIRAPYEDETALAAFAAGVDVVTFEFENVPARTAEILAASGKPVRPGPRALATAQDRLVEKQTFRDLGIETVAFAAVDDEASLAAAIKTVGAPSILKTRRLGYDGKGQARLASQADAARAWEEIGRTPAILEAMAPFEREISIVAARSADGAFLPYDACENVHRAGILDTTRVPAAVNDALALRAIGATKTLMEALGYVGVLAVEYFVLPTGALLANEFAPRVHNSGHWTSDACVTGQFEQQIRAVAGWPLGDVTRHSNVEMINLIGADADDWSRYAATPGACVHIYGKREARDGRKMGHVTRLLPLG